MKKLLTILFTVFALSSFGQSLFNRWIPASGTDTYSTNITGFTTYSNSVVYLKFANTNTTTATININSIGAQPIRAWDGDSWEVLSAGAIDVNTIYKLSYSGSYYELESFSVAGGGGGTWGSITGTLSAQTDLQSALDAKAPLASPTFTGTVTIPNVLPVTNLTSLTNSRTMTSADDLDQSDNLNIVYADSGTPFDITVDLLSAKSQVTVINKGAGTVTLIEGAGVTLVGTTIDIEEGEVATIIYEDAANPDVYLSTASAGGGGSGDLTIGVSTITSGTNGNFLINNAGLVGETTPGTGVATWFSTPSYTNFLAAITGTSPYYLTGSGGTATASNTKTFNTANWDNTTSTWTATANSQFASNETGTLTARATAADILYGRTSSRTFVASANTQELTDTYINPTFTVGAFTGTIRVGLHINSGSLFVGSGINAANIKFAVRGWGTSNSTLTADFKDSAGSSILQIGDGGTIVVRPAALMQFGGANDYISSGTANSLTFSTNSGSVTNGAYRFRWGGSSNTGGGIIPMIVAESTGSVNPTSGSTTFPSFYAITPYNVTGTSTAKGISFYSAPVITALPTLWGFKHEPTNPSNISGNNIAYESVTGSDFIGSAGGTITASTRVDQRGLGTTSSTINHRWANSSNGLLATLTDDGTFNHYGDVVLTTAGNKLYIKEGTNGSSGQVALTAGVAAITISGVTTSTRAHVTFVSVGGTVTTTWQYKAVCTSNTLTITAIDNTGATNTSDTSTLNYLIIQPAP